MCCNNMILIFNFLNTATPLKTKITEQRCSTNKRGGATIKKKKRKKKDHVIREKVQHTLLNNSNFIG